MKDKKFRVLTAITSGVLAIIVSISVIAGNVYIPLIAVAIAALISYFLRKASKMVTKDERTVQISGRAAESTIKIFIPLAAIAGIILFASREHLSTEWVSAGYVLVYTACGLMLVHLAFYSFFSRKY